MIIIVFIISIFLLMALCMGVGFLIGQFAGRCFTESRVMKAIEKKPTKEAIALGQSIFGKIQISDTSH